MHVISNYVLHTGITLQKRNKNRLGIRKISVLLIEDIEINKYYYIMIIFN